ncbi:hypothetical protein [Scytonema hofmannii]|nr:hypothetical protein [Scytonema hofmannii]
MRAKPKHCWEISPEILKEAYKQRKISIDFYIEGLVKCLQLESSFEKRGSVREFCKEWGIPERSFYRAVKRLLPLNSEAA